MEPNTLPAASLEEQYVQAGELPQIQAEEGSWFISLLRVALVVVFVLGYHW